MNKENLLRVAEAIERAPDEAFDMSDYGHGCGTPACIAGFAAQIAGENPPHYVESFAREVLDLTYRESEVLFCGQVSVSLLEGVSRFDAVALLRNAAKTGKIDWAAVGHPEIADALAEELS